MPGVYPKTGFDVAGFAVGMVSSRSVINGSHITKGDILVGLPSSGVHSNGFSLVRKALLEGPKALPLHEVLPELEESLAKNLLRPTRLYPRIVMKALENHEIRGMAHITGGGLEENIQRALPSGLTLRLDFSAWERPAIFNLIANAGVEEKEMRHVFNLGIGFCFIVSPQDKDSLVTFLKKEGESPIVFGEVVSA
jgi:phosphoribosylformylglycinamidine cyclo-ligase